MKKKIVLFVAMAMCCLLFVGLVACKDPSDSDNTKDVNEVEEFTEILNAVIGKFVDMTKSDSTATAQLAMASSEESVGSISRDTVDSAFEYLDGQSGKKESPIHEKMLSAVAVNGLVSVLAYAQTLSEVHNIDKIYNVPFRIEPAKENIDGVDIEYSGGYAIIVSKDDHKILYFYNKDEENSNETLYKYDINYKSKDDFSAKMAMLAMDEIELNSKVDEASAYYFYGDTKDRTLFMMGEWGESAMLTSNAVGYRSETGAAFGTFDTDGIINKTFEFVRSDYTSMDLELVRSLVKQDMKSFTWKQYVDNTDKIAKEHGIKQ